MDKPKHRFIEVNTEADGINEAKDYIAAMTKSLAGLAAVGKKPKRMTTSVKK